MPIQIRVIDDLWCPVVICDCCLNRIEDTHGNVYWDAVIGRATGADPLFLHKGNCTLAFENTQKDAYLLYTEELKVFVDNLAANIGRIKTKSPPT
jgi:hypothetical protein